MQLPSPPPHTWGQAHGSGTVTTYNPYSNWAPLKATVSRIAVLDSASTIKDWKYFFWKNSAPVLNLHGFAFLTVFWRDITWPLLANLLFCIRHSKLPIDVYSVWEMCTGYLQPLFPIVYGTWAHKFSNPMWGWIWDQRPWLPSSGFFKNQSLGPARWFID